MLLSRFRKPHRKSPDGKLAALLDHHEIRTVIDVGANAGQTRDRLRRIGFAGRIVSIEPVSDLQADLARRSTSDPGWDVLPPMALGARNGSADIFISEDDDLSSLRAPLESLVETLPKAAPVDRKRVDMRTLDDLWPDIGGDVAETLLKIDAQGSEAEILRGADNTLAEIRAVLVELSLRPLYEGEADYLAVCADLHRAGLTAVFFEPGYFSRAQCRLLQMDGLFVRHP